MRFVEYVDYDDAPETFVCGVGAISQIGLGTIRVTYITEREKPDGAMEYRAVQHHVWDLAKWLDVLMRFQHGRAAIEKAYLTFTRERPGVSH